MRNAVFKFRNNINVEADYSYLTEHEIAITITLYTYYAEERHTQTCVFECHAL